MSTAVQLKLLTLLNVSAVKRPREADQPGAQRRSISVSPSVQIQPRNETESPAAIGETGEEPPKKKKRGVSFGGEIGPSGSGIKKQKATKKEDAAANGSDSKVNRAGKASGSSATIATEDANELDAAGNQLLVEEDTDIEDGPAEGSSSSGSTDPFNVHFAAEPPILKPQTLAAAEASDWTSTRKEIPGLGRVVELSPGKSATAFLTKAEASASRITPQVLETFNAEHPSPSQLLTSTLKIVGKYKDLFVHGLDGDADGSGAGGFGKETEDVRSAVTMHALNHVMKTRRRIIKNNEKLARGNETNDPPQDGSFVRPKVLLLLPSRHMALHYLETHLFPLAPVGTQIENRKPFATSFGLPSDYSDPLDTAEAREKYPADHIANFKGNTDDNFRFGVKFTRKAWRVILPPANEEKLIGCDIIIASPLAIRMSADKERGSVDYLSSIEVLVADGLDVMSMQNWAFTQWIFSHVNGEPKETHGCDVSRLKPWYADQQAKFLRQTICVSRYETPEMRALFNRQLFNVEGKIRMDRTNYPGLLGHVRKGVRQVFSRIHCNDPVEELDLRFKYFTDTTLPALLKSAISRVATLIMVPDYYDFVKVTNFMKKREDFSFAAISEYSSNQEISAARTAFFKGKKDFLIVTERFHFYRRYRLRGAKTIVFYSLPDHAAFYPELMAGPFIPSATGKQTADIDEADVSARVAFSKFDWLKLERIVGTEAARRMVSDRDETKFTFV
ncbi:hypothetical protein NliqN6_4098 [Naganishia liquefaciens]|uniref:U3 small nucleolar RNA-associated protein 25 n=1 Tax=Naganishia liquefaciens TaxID=104408 RepID=A0A8H3TVG7_9TREE|nr:hypothetical protein NliqN6_4098 [Naganishia liquefaciens]